MHEIYGFYGMWKEILCNRVNLALWKSYVFTWINTNNKRNITFSTRFEQRWIRRWVLVALYFFIEWNLVTQHHTWKVIWGKKTGKNSLWYVWGTCVLAAPKNGWIFFLSQIVHKENCSKFNCENLAIFPAFCFAVSIRCFVFAEKAAFFTCFSLGKYQCATIFDLLNETVSISFGNVSGRNRSCVKDEPYHTMLLSFFHNTTPNTQKTPQQMSLTLFSVPCLVSHNFPLDAI